LSRELFGKTAVVTGSSAGIGRAIALELAAAGAALVIHGGNRVEAANQVAAEIRAKDVPALVIMADLADSTTHQPLIEQAWNWRNGVDVWVNNAGADVLTGDAASWSFDQKLQQLWQVDVRAAMRLSRSVGQLMKAVRAAEPTDDAAVILNMGWDQAECGMAGDSGEMFAAVKGAVMAFSRSLARSLAPQVRVNCLAPGWIRTAWGDGASEYWQQRACRESLLERWGAPEDVARVARFLASPDSGFITGQVIPINGGLRIGGG
jgi:3-oxoacyl-[acyl-carrier protein] reductase